MIYEYWFWMDGHTLGYIETPEILTQRETECLESEFNYRNKVSGIKLLRVQTAQDMHH